MRAVAQRSSGALSRRDFLAVSVVAAAPLIVPASVLGRAGGRAASERITLGCIGTGGMGMGNLRSFLAEEDCQVVAVCDVDGTHRETARAAVDEHYGRKVCASYRDFRELLARQDIDAVVISTPDHWHSLIGIAAAQAGKDIYGEKPLTHDLMAGRMLCDAVRRHGRIWQTGSWQRSVGRFRWAVEVVKSGAIGRIQRVEVGLPAGETGGTPAKGPVPAELDYDLWVGPAPYIPYSSDIVHYNWRHHLHFGGGKLMDWVGHHGDVAHWGLGCDRSGPIGIEASGEFPDEGLYNAPPRYRVTCTYRNGATVVVANADDSLRMGAKFIGTDGWLWVDRAGVDAQPKSLLHANGGPAGSRFVRAGHFRNFLECVRSRQETLAPAEIAHRSASIGHLGLIAMQVGRKIRWNPDTEEIMNDPAAARLLGSPCRDPWNL